MASELSIADLPSHPTLGERLGFLVRDEGLKQLILQALGISAKTLTRYVKGETEPSASEAVRISDVTKVPVAWLLTGSLEAKGGQDVDGFVRIPRLDVRASAGGGRALIPGDLISTTEIAFRESWLRSLGVQPQNAEFIVAEGDSMEPTILSGDLLLVNRAIDHVRTNGIYAIVYGGVVLVKRLQILFDQSVRVISDNSRYPPELIPAMDVADQLQVQGQVRWFGRGI